MLALMLVSCSSGTTTSTTRQTTTTAAITPDHRLPKSDDGLPGQQPGDLLVHGTLAGGCLHFGVYIYNFF